MTLPDILFWCFAALAVIPAIMCVAFSRNIVRAAFLLLLTFWGVAGLYGLLSADFLAAVQLIVYVGGILVLILFGVMLSRRMTMAELPAGTGTTFLAAAGSLALGLFLWQVIQHTPWEATSQPATSATVRPIGELFLGKFLLPFEFVSVLLLGALVGAVILARKELDEGADDEMEAEA